MREPSCGRHVPPIQVAESIRTSLGDTTHELAVAAVLEIADLRATVWLSGSDLRPPSLLRFLFVADGSAVRPYSSEPVQRICKNAEPPPTHPRIQGSALSDAARRPREETSDGTDDS